VCFGVSTGSLSLRTCRSFCVVLCLCVIMKWPHSTKLCIGVCVWS
jgi:hypothetical protein